eukprot:scaffold107925_cov43-Cyclotella_meneghiniana.AAC.2
MNFTFAIILLTLQPNVFAFSNNCVAPRSSTCLLYRKSRSINDSNIPNLHLGITKKVTVVEASLVEEIQQPQEDGFVEGILSSYIGPRFILAAVALLYGTNFSLGALMNENLPASAATSGRMLKPSLRWQVLICGAFVSLGYVTQFNIKTVKCDTDSYNIMFTAGISFSNFGTGDILSLVQAFGFGTGIYMSEKMLQGEKDQALPVTAGLVATTAFVSMIWCFLDGWMQQPNWQDLGLPGLFLSSDSTMRTVALAVLWTGVLSTSTNYCIEMTALGRVPSSEASVILATEPLWASLFAALLFNEQFGTSDYIGGILLISACLVNTLKPSDFQNIFVRSPESQDIKTRSK